MSLVDGFIDLILNSPKFQGMSSVNSEELSPFTLSKPFPMKLKLYIDHFLYQLGSSDEILVNAFTVIESLLNLETISHYNVHRIVFTTLALSYKFICNP